MKKAVGYVRVSTQEQKMHGYSLIAQREVLQKYADEHDMELVHIYADEGISASKALHKRKGILQLLDAVEKGEGEVILFKDLSRWSRNEYQFYTVQDRLDKVHVPWIAVEQPNLETVTASGKLIVGIHISVAAHESAQIGERIKFVNESRVQKKLPLTGRLPIGYKIGEIDGVKRVVKNDSDAELVAIAFDTFERTQCINQTMQELKNHGRMVWDKQLRVMLRNPIYKGTYHDVEDYCEPYIMAERWERIQNLLNHRHYTPPTENRYYIFSSLIQCKECGRMMAGKTKTGNLTYYQCPKHGLHLCEHQKMIREDLIEQHLIALVNEAPQKQIVVKPKRKKHVNVKPKLERLKELYIDGDISKDEYMKRKADLESLTVTEQLPPRLVSNWKELYDSATKQQKNVIWKSVIDRIIVDKDNNIDVHFR